MKFVRVLRVGVSLTFPSAFLLGGIALGESGASVATEYNCVMGSGKRTIRVTYENENAKVPCKVNYEREAGKGEAKVIFNASSKEGFCEMKAGEFAEKLKSMGWTCSNP